MYLTKSFEEKDLAKIIPILLDYPFATLISHFQDRLLSSPLPLTYDQDEHCFWGHLAIANPHYQCFTQQSRVLILFQGPHAYVSPDWYDSTGVPTWNYVSVEVTGHVELISNRELQTQVLEKQLAQFDPQLQTKLLSELPEVQKDRMFEMICGFRVEIEQMQAKFKLSQNRPSQDRQSVIAQYRALGGDQRLQLAELMAQIEST